MTAHNVTRWADYAVMWGLNAVLAASVVTGVALIAAALARRTPVLRYGLLCSCLAVLAATPLLALLTPSTGHSLWSWGRDSRTSQVLATERITSSAALPKAPKDNLPRPDAVVVAANAVGSSAFAPTSGNLPAPAAADRSSEVEAPVATAPSPPAELRPFMPSGIRRASAARQAASWLVLLWMVVALLGFIRLAMAWRRLTQIIGDARPVVGDAMAILAECRRQLGIEREIALVAADQIASPFAAGLRRVHIVLPGAWAARANLGQLRTVLLHEAAHVARHDPAMAFVQQLIAAFYWFHPLVRLFNVRLAEAREETCDNHVLATVDAPAYSRTLLMLAELIQPGRSLPATAGLFASHWRLERRIAGLLDERRNRATRLTLPSKAIVSALALVATFGAVLVAGTLARGQSSEQKPDARSPDADGSPSSPVGEAPPTEALATAVAAAERSFKSVETAHVRYRQTLITGPFKPGVTPERCVELLTKYDLATRPESLRDLLVEILATETVAPAPWSEKELYTANPGTATERVRETRHSFNRDPDVHVVTPEVSLRWDGANSQLNVDAARENRFGYTRLADFLRAAHPELLRRSGLSVVRGHLGGDTVLCVNDANSAALIDAEAGVYLSVDSGRDGDVQLQRWLGWKSPAGGPPFPTAIIKLRFTRGQLHMVGATLVDAVRLNPPLSPATFALGAPAGSVVVDNRNGRNRVVRINRDVFDASSADQVREAAKPLKQEPTPTELAAFDDLRQMYVLGEGEALRRLGPPYPLSRNYLMRMLRPDAAAERRGTDNAVIEWKDGELGELRTFYAGFAPKLEHLIGAFFNQPLADVEIPADVLAVELPGDYIVRSDATRNDLAAALSAIVSQELGRSVLLQFEDVSREVFVARGTMNLDESKLRVYSGRPLIAVNGGDHAGDHGETVGFGNLSRLLNELSEYVDVKIVDETTSSDRQIAWSKRWYDRDDTPAAQRFRLNRQTVLDSVSQQAGVIFERQTRTVNVLTLAKP